VGVGVELLERRWGGICAQTHQQTQNAPPDFGQIAMTTKTLDVIQEIQKGGVKHKQTKAKQKNDAYLREVAAMRHPGVFGPEVTRPQPPPAFMPPSMLPKPNR